MVNSNFKRARIGEILLDKNVITKEQLEEALEIQKRTGEKLGRILIDKGYVSESIFTELLSYQRGFEYIDLTN